MVGNIFVVAPAIYELPILHLSNTIQDQEKSQLYLCNILKNDIESAIFCIDYNAKNRFWSSKLVIHLMQIDYPWK